MTLEFYEYDECGVVMSRFVDCPLCGHDFDECESRSQHFLDEHTPEDAGLTPLGTISDDANSALWGNPDEAVDGAAD